MIMEDSTKKEIITDKSCWMIFLHCVTVGLGSLQFGYCFTNMSILPIRQIALAFHMPYSIGVNEGLLSGTLTVGGGIGSLYSSSILGRLTKRECLILASALMIVGTSFMLVPDYRWLLFGRLIQGICLGLFTSICPRFIMELSPKSLLSGFGSIHHYMVITGHLLSSIIILFVDSESTQLNPIWVLTFTIPALLAVTQIVLLSWFFNNDSVRELIANGTFLIYSGLYQKARRIIEKNYNAEYVQEIYQEQVDDAALQKDDVASDSISMSYCLRTILAIVLINAPVTCGTQITVMYCWSILTEVTSITTAKYIQTGITFLKIATCVLTFKLLERLGSKNVLQLGLLVCGVCLLIIGSGLKNGSQMTGTVVVQTALIILMVVFGMTIGSVAWGYAQVIAPKRLLPYIVFGFWINTSIGLFLFPVLRQLMQQAYIFWMLGGLAISVFAINQLLMVQPKDLSQREIYDEFGRHINFV